MIIDNLLLFLFLLKHNYIVLDEEYIDDFDHIDHQTSSDRTLRGSRSTTNNSSKVNDEDDGKQNRFVYVYIAYVILIFYCHQWWINYCNNIILYLSDEYLDDVIRIEQQTRVDKTLKSQSVEMFKVRMYYCIYYILFVN